MKLFISYAHKDIKTVKRLVKLLENAGHEVWWDIQLKAGQTWQGQLEDEIKNCDIFVYVMTANSAWSVSEWCHWEFVTAVENDKPVLPLLMQTADDDFTLPVAISRLQYADLTDGLKADAIVKMLSDLDALHVDETEDFPAKPENPTGNPSRVEINQTVTASDNAQVNVIGQQNIENQTKIENQYVGDKASKWLTSFNVIVGIAGIIGVIFAIIAVLPEPQRDNLLFSIGLVPPSATPTMTSTATPTFTPTTTPTLTPTATLTHTPTATYTSTNTSTPTYTPTITPTATLIPFNEDEVGIILFEFDEVNDSIGMRSRIINQLQDEDVNLRLIPYLVDKDLTEDEQREQVQAVSDQYNATIAMWGEGFTFGVEVFYEITAREDRYISTTVDAIAVPADLENFSTYILNGMDTLYIVNFTLGQLHYFEDDYETALAFFDEAVERISSEREEDVKAYALYFYRGTSKDYLKNYEGALVDYDQAVSLYPDDSAIYYNRGIAKSNLGDYEGAIADYDQAITLDPDFAEAFNNRGIAKSDLDYYVDAITDYDTAITLNPDFAIAYNNRGNAKSDLGYYVDAITDYDTAITLDANLVPAYNNRGSAKQALGEYPDAIIDYDTAINLNPDYAEPYNNRGTAKYGLGNRKGAIADYDTAIKLDPNYAEPYYNRGIVKYDLKDYEGTIDDFTQAINLKPDYAFAYNNRGFTKLFLKNYAGAIDDFTQAINLNPNNANPYWSRANSYYELSQYSEALADYQKYIELEGEEYASDGMLERITELEAQLGEGD